MLVRACVDGGCGRQLNKSDYETLADRALVFSLDNNIARALAYYEQVLAIKPPEPEVFLLRMAEDCFRESRAQAHREHTHAGTPPPAA